MMCVKRGCFLHGFRTKQHYSTNEQGEQQLQWFIRALRSFPRNLQEKLPLRCNPTFGTWKNRLSFCFDKISPPPLPPHPPNYKRPHEKPSRGKTVSIEALPLWNAAVKDDVPVAWPGFRTRLWRTRLVGKESGNVTGRRKWKRQGHGEEVTC